MLTPGLFRGRLSTRGCRILIGTMFLASPLKAAAWLFYSLWEAVRRCQTQHHRNQTLGNKPPRTNRFERWFSSEVMQWDGEKDWMWRNQNGANKRLK